MTNKFEVATDLADAASAEAVICRDVTNPLILPDNLVAACAGCSKPIQHRPDVPEGPVKLCAECAMPLMQDAASRDDLRMVVTPKTVAEVAEFKKGQSTMGDAGRLKKYSDVVPQIVHRDEITRDLMRKVASDVAVPLRRMLRLAPESGLPIALAAGKIVIAHLCILLDANPSPEPDPDCILLAGLLLGRYGANDLDMVRGAYRDFEILKAGRAGAAIPQETRVDALHRLDAVSFDELTNHMGEMVHVAFRKGSDHPGADVVWKAIRALPPEEWDKVIDFILHGLRFTTGREKPREG